MPQDSYRDPRSVVLIVDEGSNPFELACACEVFGARRRPEIGRELYRFRVVTPRRRVAVRDAMFTIGDDGDLGDVDHAHTVVVPNRPDTDTPTHPAVIRAVQRAHRRGARLVGLCTGAYTLAEAGLLDGRPAAVHWQLAGDFRRRHPEVNLRVAAPEVAGQLPVHRCRAPVDQAGLGQCVGAGAQADQPGASLVRTLHGLDDRRMGGRVGVGPVGHDDGVRLVDVAQAADVADGEHRVADGHAASGGHDAEPVQLAADFRAPPGAEHLARAGQFEGVGALVGDEHDQPRVAVGILRHVAFLALAAAPAPGQYRCGGEG